MADVTSLHVQALVTEIEPSVTSLHVQAMVTETKPDITSLHVQVLLGDGPFFGPPPRWVPLYLKSDYGWLPTFPRWLFDNHPPRGTP